MSDNDSLNVRFWIEEREKDFGGRNVLEEEEEVDG